MKVVLYAGSERSTTTDSGRTTHHSFSFGPHYDPANLGFGPLVCHNDDVLAPGAGYPDHPHAALEIVTWVLEGALVHTDSGGARHVVEAGHAQVLSSGSGVRHSEIADLASGQCRFVQAWLTSDDPSGTPAYSVDQAPLGGDGLVAVAGVGGLPIRTSRASLSVARVTPGQVLALPDGVRHHVYAASGAVEVAGQALGPGDALRLTDAGGAPVSVAGAGELLVWALP